MTIIAEILEILEDTLDMTETTAELIKGIPQYKPSSVRSALSRAVKKKILDRIERGVYKLIKVYYKIEVTKTSRYENKEKGDIEIDATLEGWIKNTELDLISRKIDGKVKVNTNLELIEQIKEILEDNFDQIDGLTVIKIEKSGWEILDNDHNFVRSTYSMSWDYDIDITTNSGTYNSKGSRTIAERDIY